MLPPHQRSGAAASVVIMVQFDCKLVSWQGGGMRSLVNFVEVGGRLIGRLQGQPHYWRDGSVPRAMNACHSATFTGLAGPCGPSRAD